MKPNRFLIIGAGQLGSRHLQALVKYDRTDFEIAVVDPSSASLSLARQRMEEMPNNPLMRNASFHESVGLVKGSVDFAVIATNANHRLKALEQLLAVADVKHLLLEKVLFPSSNELDKAAVLIEKYGVDTWVNCPRRMYALYAQLQAHLHNDRNICLEVRGGQWGLACNAIHFIDLWAFLSQSVDYRIDTGALDVDVLESKRAGYKELTGTLRGVGDKGFFSLTCDREILSPEIKVTIRSENATIHIDEIARLVKATDSQGRELLFHQYEPVPQSNLTHQVATALLAEGHCPLTPFNESAVLHRTFLDGLLEFFNQRAVPPVICDVCPVT